MTQACAACQAAAPGESRLKAAALLVGAILFCPCHLPATIAVLALFGGTAWLAGNPALLYLVFGVTYLFIIGYGVMYLVRRREVERAREALHAQHVDNPTPSSATGTAA